MCFRLVLLDESSECFVVVHSVGMLAGDVLPVGAVHSVPHHGGQDAVQDLSCLDVLALRGTDQQVG